MSIIPILLAPTGTSNGNPDTETAADAPIIAGISGLISGSMDKVLTII